MINENISVPERTQHDISSTNWEKEQGRGIVLIGAGNLATHLSKALQNAGFEITQVYSRSEKSASELAGMLQTNFTIDIDCIVTDAFLYIICVSDDAIARLVEKLPLTDQLVVHTAGSVPMEVLSGKLQNYGVLYPLQTFSKTRPVDFSGIPVFLEANTLANEQQLQQVARKISGKVYHADSAERMQLHLAAVFGCNFVNYLYHISARIVQHAGFNFDILSPLIDETACKAVASGNPQAVQTGPAARGDQQVMLNHLRLLENHPAWQEIYELLSWNIGNKK